MPKILTAFFVSVLLCTLGKADDLVLGPELIQQMHTAVYEIPPMEGRDVVVRNLERALKDILPEAEIVDGSAGNDATMRQKIRGTFLLVTILSEDSRLLRLVAQPLPLHIEKGTLRWADFSAPVKDLNMAFFGKNPFASGYSVVLAAGSVNGLGGVHDPGRSYLIYRGAELLKSGTYDRNFVPTDHK